jgi:hypothetical protein
MLTARSAWGEKVGESVGQPAGFKSGGKPPFPTTIVINGQRESCGSIRRVQERGVG